MAFQASHRGARTSARKVRPLASLIRGKRADEALNLLRYQPQKGARLLEKVLNSALANAEFRRAPGLANMMVIDARIDGGPMFKRIRPRARGMAFGILRRSAHISITVGSPEELKAARTPVAKSFKAQPRPPFERKKKTGTVPAASKSGKA